MSHARISSALGVRPTPYLGDCALANSAALKTAISNRSLCHPILHAPIGSDAPRKHRIVRPGHAEILVVRLIEILRGLGSRGLPCAQFVRAARQDHALLAVPCPGKSKPCMSHGICRRTEFRKVPGLL